MNQNYQFSDKTNKRYYSKNLISYLAKYILNKKIISAAFLTFYATIWAFGDSLTQTPDNTTDETKPMPVTALKINAENLTPLQTMTEEEYDNYLNEQNKNRTITNTDMLHSKKAVNSTEPVLEVAPNTPTHFNIEPMNGMAHLTWDAMPRAIAYLIYISEDGKNFKRRADKDAKQGHDIIIGVLENGKTYYFGIVSIGRGGESKKVITKVIPEESNK